MIIANDQKELDSHSCPACGEYELEIGPILWSCPCQFTARCRKCNHKEPGQGSPIKVLTGEEAVKMRPNYYLDHKDPAFRRLAKEIISINFCRR